jgi:hypothetical protein
MVDFSGIISLLFTVCIIGTIAYIIKKRFENGKDWSSFFNNGDYCDYCGAKLIENPMGSTPWNNINRACPNCGYDCKKPGD